MRGRRRQIAECAVITCIGVLVPFALRYHLWWLVGTSNSAAGLGQLAQLLGISAAGIFAASYLARSLWRMRRDQASRPG
jgi:hypothetical protein